MAAAGAESVADRARTRLAHLSEQEAVDTVLARFADAIGSDGKTILALRRYALTGDRRAPKHLVLTTAHAAAGAGQSSVWNGLRSRLGQFINGLRARVWGGGRRRRVVRGIALSA